MANLNLSRFKKDELVWMAKNHCEHRHTYLSHLNCYQKLDRSQQRVGYFDIETQGLDAGFGIMLSYAIKVAGKNEIISDVITLRDIKKAKAGNEDERIIRSCIDNIMKFDVIVTHYGNDFRHDVPFVRTRAVAMDIPFPEYGTLKHYDTYPILKSKFRLPSNRQETAARVLLGETEKNHIDPAIWRRAGRGDSKALKYVLDHNERDVRDLEKIYSKIAVFVRRTDKSI